MARSVLKVTAAVTLALAALAGCSSQGEAGPQPTGSGSGSSTAPSDDPSNGAPKVEHPLDTGKFQKDPCSVLTAAQVQSLGLSKKGEPDVKNALGPKCFFSGSAAPVGMGFGVTFVTANTQGLASIYGQKDTLKVFDPQSIQGYPAIDYGVSDMRSEGSMGLAVGVTDQLTFEVDLDIDKGAPNQSNPLPVAVKIADMVITNVKGA